MNERVTIRLVWPGLLNFEWEGGTYVGYMKGVKDATAKVDAYHEHKGS